MAMSEGDTQDRLAETPKRAKDILAAESIEDALNTYHSARAEGLNKRSELMITLGRKLLDFGQKEAAMQWTLRGEEAATVEEAQATQRLFQNNVHELRSTTLRLGSISEELGKKLDRGSREMGESADRFKMGVIRLEGVLQEFQKTSARTVDDLRMALDGPSGRIMEAADKMNIAAIRMSERRGGY